MVLYSVAEISQESPLTVNRTTSDKLLSSNLRNIVVKINISCCATCLSVCLENWQRYNYEDSSWSVVLKCEFARIDLMLNATIK